MDIWLNGSQLLESLGVLKMTWLSWLYSDRLLHNLGEGRGLGFVFEKSPKVILIHSEDWEPRASTWSRGQFWWREEPWRETKGTVYLIKLIRADTASVLTPLGKIRALCKRKCPNGICMARFPKVLINFPQILLYYSRHLNHYSNGHSFLKMQVFLMDL